MSDGQAWSFPGKQIGDQTPEYVLEVFRKYWDGGEFPEKIKGFPYIRYFRDKGFEVLGAARYQGDWRMRVPNTTAFCEALSEEGARGMVNTQLAREYALSAFLQWRGASGGKLASDSGDS